MRRWTTVKGGEVEGTTLGWWSGPAGARGRAWACVGAYSGPVERARAAGACRRVRGPRRRAKGRVAHEWERCRACKHCICNGLTNRLLWRNAWRHDCFDDEFQKRIADRRVVMRVVPGRGKHTTHRGMLSDRTLRVVATSTSSTLLCVVGWSRLAWGRLSKIREGRLLCALGLALGLALSPQASLATSQILLQS